LGGGGFPHRRLGLPPKPKDLLNINPSPVPGDRATLLARVGGYNPGTIGRVIAVRPTDVCVVEFDDGAQLAIATQALRIVPWSISSSGVVSTAG
jgi:hypothetical protein